VLNRHTDGSACKEGTRDLPADFAPCCEIFGAHVATCEYDIRYEWWPEQRFWVIAIAAGAGSGGIWIGHCPHCGQRLRPASQRPADADSQGGQPGRWLRI